MIQKTEIARIKKKDNVETVIAIAKWQGKVWVDIRDYFRPAQLGTWVPTKKGVFIEASKVTDLIVALENVERTLFETLPTQQEGGDDG